jgi:hypothetical protein
MPSPTEDVPKVGLCGGPRALQWQPSCPLPMQGGDRAIPLQVCSPSSHSEFCGASIERAGKRPATRKIVRAVARKTAVYLAPFRPVALRDCCVAMLSRRVMPLSVPRQKASRKMPLIVRACNCRKHSDIAVRCGEHSKGQCRPSGDFDAWICEGGCAGPTSLSADFGAQPCMLRAKLRSSNLTQALSSSVDRRARSSVHLFPFCRAEAPREHGQSAQCRGGIICRS